MNNSIPKNFDWRVYTGINNDLKHFNEKEAMQHFTDCGYLENRIYKLIQLDNKNVVFITSKIYVSNAKFSYSNNRSIYTPEQRYYQTIETILSIRMNIPNSYIILFDNSVFKDQQHFNFLNNNVDVFLNITNDETLNFYTDRYEYKAFSDMYQQLMMYNSFLKFVDLKTIKNIFKISGRYVINTSFQFKNFDNTDIIFKKNKDVIDRDYYYTCFYKLTPTIIIEYFNKLQMLINNKHLYENNTSDLEVILPKLFIDKMKPVQNLGITQRIAVFNTIEDI
jgi:hypothetical protein